MSGNTKREPPISWRPSTEAREALARLVTKTGLSRNDILNKAALLYESQVNRHQSAKEHSEAADRQAVLSRNVKDTEKVIQRMATRIDRDKLAAFQRKAGMDSAKARK